MSSVPGQLCQRWGHSFEEDAANVQVYRPAGYEFPPARGRDGIEFRPDGSFIQWTVGPGDANQPVPGRWSEPAPGVLRVEHAGTAGSGQNLQIVELTPEVLKVRSS